MTVEKDYILVLFKQSCKSYFIRWTGDINIFIENIILVYNISFTRSDVACFLVWKEAVEETESENSYLISAFIIFVDIPGKK